MSAELSFVKKMAESPLSVVGEVGEISLKTPKGIFETDRDLPRIVEDIRAQLEITGVPEFLKTNPFYKFAVLNTPKKEDVNAIKNIIPFIPRLMDRISVERNIQLIAQRLVDELKKTCRSPDDYFEKTKSAIRNALLFNLGESLKLIDETPIIRKDALHTENEGLLCTGEIRSAVLRIKDRIDIGELDKDDADIALLHDLGVTDGSEDSKKIKEDLMISISAGWELYEELGESLAKAQAEFGIGGEQIRISPNHFSKGKGMYELLIQAIGNNKPHKTKTGRALLFNHEAQAAAYLGFLFFHLAHHPAFIESRKIVAKYRLMVGSGLFGEREMEGEEDLLTEDRVYLDSHRNIIAKPDEPGQNDIFTPYQIRELDIDGCSQKYRVWFDDIDKKMEKPIIKRLINSPDFNFEDVPDIIRGRLVLWDYNRNDLVIHESDTDEVKSEKEKKLADLDLIVRKIGTSMGLKHSYVERVHLGKGHFCIKNKLDENKKNGKSHEAFAFKLYGVNEQGVHIEFQILPKDVFESTNSWRSPNNHQFYDMEKDLDVAKAVLRLSSSPRAHEVAELAKKRLKEKKSENKGLRMGKIH